MSRLCGRHDLEPAAAVRDARDLPPVAEQRSAVVIGPEDLHGLVDLGRVMWDECPSAVGSHWSLHAWVWQTSHRWRPAHGRPGRRTTVRGPETGASTSHPVMGWRQDGVRRDNDASEYGRLSNIFLSRY